MVIVLGLTVILCPLMVSMSYTLSALLPIIFHTQPIINIYVTHVSTHVAASYNTRFLYIPHTSGVIIVPIAYILNMSIHT